MLYKHFTEKLLGLQGLNITNIEENEKSIIIYAEMERKEHTCICCGMPTKEAYVELKLLARQYYQIMSQFIKAKVNLSNLLDQVMPDIQNLLTDNMCNHKLTDFIVRYWHYENIIAIGEKRFIADYCKWAKKQGHRVYEHLAKNIFAVAQNGIPVLPNSQSTKIVVTEAVRVLHGIEISRNTILAQMQTIAKSLPEYSVVREMPCIGDTLAPRIIAEIGDISRFNNKHSLTLWILIRIGFGFLNAVKKCFRFLDFRLNVIHLI